jgi:hypothetical protein
MPSAFHSRGRHHAFVSICLLDFFARVHQPSALCPCGQSRSWN